MVNYSKDIFVIPLTDNDTSVKIRDINNNIRYVIKDGYCQLKVDGANMLIKQKSDTRVTKLDFNSAPEASAAIPILEAALKKMLDNIKRISEENSFTTTGGCDGANKTVLMQYIWTDSNLIPITPPIVSDPLIQIYTDLLLIHETGTNSFSHPNFIDIIPPAIGIGYKVVVKTYDDQIIPDDWRGMKIYYDCGKVEFQGGLTEEGTLKVSATKPPKVSFYRYLGTKGSIAPVSVWEYVIITDNTTTINLSFVPNGVINVFINGVAIPNHPDNYIVIGSVFTWNSTEYTLDTGDTISIIFV